MRRDRVALINEAALRDITDCADLQQQFEEWFWCEDLGFHAFALNPIPPSPPTTWAPDSSRLAVAESSYE